MGESGFVGDGGGRSEDMRVVRAVIGRRGQQKMRSESSFGVGLKFKGDMVVVGGEAVSCGFVCVID